MLSWVSRSLASRGKETGFKCAMMFLLTWWGRQKLRVWKSHSVLNLMYVHICCTQRLSAVLLTLSWQIHILLPPLQKLRTVVEHMRQMSDVMAIQANHLGNLRLSVYTDAVKVDTQWSNCVIPNFGELLSIETHCRWSWKFSVSKARENTQEEEPEAEQYFSALVSIRSFIKFLSSHVVSTTTIACALIMHPLWQTGLKAIFINQVYAIIIAWSSTCILERWLTQEEYLRSTFPLV